MIKFCLFNKSGEVINSTWCTSLHAAIAYFAIIKNLPKEELLRIFDVK
jgi:hypothetical protein